MCVIMVANGDTRITEDSVKKGFEKHPSGAGAAWLEEKDGRKAVRWSKGLTLEEVVTLNKTIPLPYVLHFRNPSVGTALGPFGCHPFPISPDADTTLEGTIDGAVLFHNGMWSDWKNKIIELACKVPFKLPTGSWTDTRALALASNYLGLGLLELINEKVAVFKTDDIELFGDWTYDDGVWYSNTEWKHVSHYLTPPFSMGGHRGGRGASDQTSFRGTGGSAGYWKDREKEIQSTDAATSGTGDGTITQTQKVTALAQRDKHCACGKVAGIWTTSNNVAQCWDCYQKKPAVLTIHSKSGMCDFCDPKDVHNANHRLAGTFEWICGTCWMKKDRPRIMGTAVELTDIEELKRREKIRDASKRGIQIVCQM